jgi:hypothetical protein
MRAARGGFGYVIRAILLTALVASCVPPDDSSAPVEHTTSAATTPLCQPPVIDTVPCCGSPRLNQFTGQDETWSNTDRTDFLFNLRAKMPLFAPFNPGEATIVTGWVRNAAHDGHGAIDYVKQTGDPSFKARAVGPGRVISVATEPTGLADDTVWLEGNNVTVEHTAPDGSRFRSIYVHLRDGAVHDCLQAQHTATGGYQTFMATQTCAAGRLDPTIWGPDTDPIAVKVGDMVTAGQIIGDVGQTGAGAIGRNISDAGVLSGNNIHLHLYFAAFAVPEAKPANVPNTQWVLVDPYGVYGYVSTPNCYDRGAATAGHWLFAPFAATFAGEPASIVAQYLDYYPVAGYEAQTLSVYPSGTLQLAAGSFQPNLSSESVAMISRSKTDFLQDLNNQAAQDLQLRELQVSSLQGGDIRYNGIWTRRTAPTGATTALDQDDAAFGALEVAEFNSGGRIVDEMAYRINGTRMHAVIFVSDGVTTSWNDAFGSSGLGILNIISTNQAGGRQPISLSAEPPGDTTYGGLFLAAQGDWVAEPQIANGPAGFLARNAQRTLEGRRLYRVQGYGGGQNFAAIWVKNEQSPVASLTSSAMSACPGLGSGWSVTLDASNSTHDPTFPLGYEWTGAFGSVRGQTERVGLPPGASTVSLRAYDSRGLQSTTSATLNIPASPRQALGPGASMFSPNGQYRLVMQSNGNLVLFQRGVASPVWTSGTSAPGVSAVMQYDGNLVVGSWGTNTFGQPGSCFVVQDDGNIVIYTAGGVAIWDRLTPAPPSGSCGTISKSQGLAQGRSLASCNGQYTLSMQLDGNLVLSQTGGAALWGSGTYGTGNLNMVVLQAADGNFVIYNRLTSQPLWGTGTSDTSPGTRVVVRDDGKLVVLSGAGQILQQYP